MAQQLDAEASQIDAETSQIALLSDAATEELLQDFGGYIHAATQGFFKKYFPDSDENNQQVGAFQRLIRRNEDQREFITGAPSPGKLVHWFSKFSLLDLESDGGRGRWQLHRSLRAGADAESQALFSLYQPPAFGDSGEKQDWHHVQVVGRFYRDTSNVDYRDGLLTLCESARRVFDSQPERLFLHGFYLRGSLAELWVFDRSGMYSSQSFDYQDDFRQFVSILLAYQSMTDEELGKNNLIMEDRSGRYIQADGIGGRAQGQKLLIENRPITISKDVVGNGTTCYRAKAPNASSWEHVVKFKWRLAARDRPEQEMLKLINEKNVWGVVSLDWCKQFATTASLRQGLQCGRYRRFLPERPGTKVTEQIVELEGILNRTEETDTHFEDRVGTCIITSPPGRPLNTFKSALELLQVLRDAIKSHQSLLQDANVLHQDVSPGNIIIIDTQSEDQPRGILIDFDVAMDLAVGPRTPGEVTGTRPFMAIGILLGRRHWYRHDLESFLFVFIWTVITNGSESPSRESRLRKWSRGDWDDLAKQKTSDMEKDNFQDILAEFPSSFHSLKPLAETLRQILFPIVDGVIWTGVDNDPDVRKSLYDRFINAFEGAISSSMGK